MNQNNYRWARLESFLAGFYQTGMYPGFHSLVFQHGSIVHEFTCGMQDAALQKPIQADTLYRLYSMTKPITCTALMMLFEEGRFFLDEPIFTYIPEFKHMHVLTGIGAMGPMLEPAARPITFRHLLTHTAGLGYGILIGPVEDLFRQTNNVDLTSVSPNVSLPEMIRSVASLPLASQPGTRFGYSVAHDVIGFLIGLLSGMPFEEFLYRRLFEPLGMVDTGFYVPAEKIDRLSTLYSYKGGQLTPCDPAAGGSYSHPPLAALGGSGLVSSTADYLRFSRMLLNGGELEGEQILSRKTVELMTSNHLAPSMLPWSIFPEFPALGSGYGLGVSVMMDRAAAGVLTSNGTFGWGGAAGTHMFIDPQEDLIAILMTQTMSLVSDPLPPVSDLYQRLVYQAI